MPDISGIHSPYSVKCFWSGNMSHSQLDKERCCACSKFWVVFLNLDKGMDSQPCQLCVSCGLFQKLSGFALIVCTVSDVPQNLWLGWPPAGLGKQAHRAGPLPPSLLGPPSALHSRGSHCGLVSTWGWYQHCCTCTSPGQGGPAVWQIVQFMAQCPTSTGPLVAMGTTVIIYWSNWQAHLALVKCRCSNVVSPSGHQATRDTEWKGKMRASGGGSGPLCVPASQACGGPSQSARICGPSRHYSN